MAYLQDDTWQAVKQLAKQNGFVGDWILIIHLYYENGGNNVQVHTAIDNKNYRILRILDNKQVLLVDREGNIAVEDYELVNDSQKSFFYSDMHKVELTLPEGCSFNGKQRIKIYI